MGGRALPLRGEWPGEGGGGRMGSVGVGGGGVGILGRGRCAASFPDRGTAARWAGTPTSAPLPPPAGRQPSHPLDGLGLPACKPWTGPSDDVAGSFGQPKRTQAQALEFCVVGPLPTSLAEQGPAPRSCRLWRCPSASRAGGARCLGRACAAGHGAWAGGSSMRPRASPGPGEGCPAPSWAPPIPPCWAAAARSAARRSPAWRHGAECQQATRPRRFQEVHPHLVLGASASWWAGAERSCSGGAAGSAPSCGEPPFVGAGSLACLSALVLACVAGATAHGVGVGRGAPVSLARPVTHGLGVARGFFRGTPCPPRTLLPPASQARGLRLAGARPGPPGPLGAVRNLPAPVCWGGDFSRPKLQVGLTPPQAGRQRNQHVFICK
jgi:hypothetical protein